MNSNESLGILQKLGGGHVALAKICIIGGFASVFVAAIAARLPDTAKDALYWIQRGIVSAAIITLLILFIKYPRHASRPEGLTLPLVMSIALALASLVTAFWPGVFVALVTPLLVAVSWLWERFSRD
ncbi:hypothetical protein [Streptomyces griseomycini]|uniref:Uncharacterized protein n=1 Tax=Streptomyces griseomycini TaxID=66895 RepID=A0A7W7PNS4_9ACTN|nr:hypothetical protein [Streptomyces griseomycini]MBB4897741.1 hypothetical protein [Streptomyces griseomycini]GGQ20430.1 hypothetical protein GCM10010266_49480 [Streptomyces griseomycini]GGR11703.1 hypothetical protein GCM10015536_16510 [Streptomyces griseomycini]